MIAVACSSFGNIYESLFSFIVFKGAVSWEVIVLALCCIFMSIAFDLVYTGQSTRCTELFFNKSVLVAVARKNW